VVISDFESFSYYFGKAHRIPVIDLDNIHILSKCRHSPALLRGHERDFGLIRSVVAAKLPRCFHYLIPTFFYPPVRSRRTTLVPPILRSEVLAARSERGEHLLVYQTATTNLALPETLRRLGVPARVYGLRRDLTEDLVDGNVTYRPFGEARFIEDLRTARGRRRRGIHPAQRGGVPPQAGALRPGGGSSSRCSTPSTSRSSATAPTPGASRTAPWRPSRATPRARRALAGYTQDGNAVALAAVKEQLARGAAWSKARRSTPVLRRGSERGR
jgi:hypothetical protein